MQANEWDILILKPTYAFSLFLTQQLPSSLDYSLPSKHHENTAYIIKKQPDDNKLLDEIEKHFNFMFSFECSRLLSKDQIKNLKGSFLDFLCCFKFEIHSHVIMMDDTLEHNPYVLRFKPRALLLKWLKIYNPNTSHPILHQMSLSDFSDNSPVIIKKIAKAKEIREFIQQHCALIIEAEQSRTDHIVSKWPTISTYEEFSQYFAIEIHKQLIKLPSGEIKKQDELKTFVVS